MIGLANIDSTSWISIISEVQDDKYLASNRATGEFKILDKERDVEEGFDILTTTEIISVTKVIFEKVTEAGTQYELVQECYHQLVEARFKVLIDPNREHCFGDDSVKKAGLIINKYKKSISTLLQSFNLEALPARKGEPLYENWIRERSRLSTTISGIKMSPSDDEGCLSSANWLATDEFVFDLAARRTPMTILTICEIHKMLAKGLVNNGGEAGQLRSEDIGCGGKNYIPSLLVQKKIEEYVQWFNENISTCEATQSDQIDFAAMAYQRLVSIHPFSDANGRCCRMVMDYTLQYFKFPPALMTSEYCNAAVFVELKNEKNIHPKIVIHNVYRGVEMSLKMLQGL